MTFLDPVSWLRRLSLRGKLLAITLTVTVAAVVVVSAAVSVLTIRNFRAATVRKSEHVAETLAEFVVAPLMFEDAAGSRDVLAHAATLPDVMSVAIYRADGRLFADYRRRSADPPPPAALADVRTGFAGDHLDVVREVRMRGQRYGAVYIRTGTRELSELIGRFLLAAALIGLGVIALCALLARRLERIISSPLLALARVAGDVSRRGDYSLRVVRGEPQPDEIGQLYAAFDEMLSTIEQRQRERETAERALRESEARYRAVVEDQTELICRYDADGTRTFVNDAYCRYFGRTREDLIGRSFMIEISETSRAAARAHFASLTRERPVGTHEVDVVLPSGEVRRHQWTDHAIFGPDGAVVEYQGVGRDVTDLRRAEEEKDRLARRLEHAQRLETIGTLAGGIAHDFNNVLTPIIGSLQLAQLKLGDRADARQLLDVALESAERARDVTARILTFSRHTDSRREPMRIQDIVRQAYKLVRAGTPATIDVRLDLEDDAPAVLGDAGQFYHVIMNLCTNAAHAMEGGGGRIDIGLRAVDVKPGAAGPERALPPGRYVRLTVGDTGHGIPAEIRERIFEPFFTTKDKAKGTGLGLSVVHGIVAEHEGIVWADSDPRAGTTLTILLPATTEPAAAPQAVAQAPGPGHGRILLVDDEPAIGTIARQFLQTLGYEIVLATSASEALAIFRRDAATFALVITDQTMPEMTGTELAAELRALRGDIGIVLSSGYQGAVGEDVDAEALGVVGLLPKPYRMEVLAETVRSALARTPSRA